MLSTQGNAAPAAPTPHLADTQQSDFHAVLASYTSAAQPAQQTVSRDVQADKSIKTIDRARSATNDAKVSRKDARAEAKAAKKSEAKAGKDSENSQPVVAVEPVRAPMQVRVAAAPHSAANDDNEADDSSVAARAPAQIAASKQSPISQPAKIAPSSSGTPTTNAETISNTRPETAPVQTDDRRPPSREQGAVTQPSERHAPELVQNISAQTAAQGSAPANTPNASVKEISRQAMDDVIAAAKSDTKQPAENSAPKPAPNAAPGVVRTLAANVTAMLNAMRGAVTVSSPKQAAPNTAEVKSGLATAAKAAPAADRAPQEPNIAKDAVSAPVLRTVQTAPSVRLAQDDARDGSEAPKLQDRRASGSDVDVAAAVKTNVVSSEAVAINTVTSMQAGQNDPHAAQNTAKDQNRPASGNVAKTDIAKADAAPLNAVREDVQPSNNAPVPQAAAASTQPATPAAQIIAAATPNAVNATAPVQASAPSHQLPAGLQAETPPNIPALAAAIAAKSAAGTKTFDIRMDPPELGRVDVHLTVDRDGKVQATLSAEQPQTLALLRQDSHNLERSLKDAGLDLSNNSLNFSLKGEGRQGDGGGASMARARSLPDAVVARAEAANASMSNYNYASGDGRLDIRV